MALGDRDYMRPGSGGRSAFSWDWLDAVTLILIANIAVFILQRVIGEAVDVHENHVVPWGALSLKSLLEGRVLTLVTHMFVHENLLHLFGNMLMVFMAGRGLQSLIGPKNFLYIYFTAGLVGAALHLVMEHFMGHSPGSMMYGASGCAFGIFVALAAILPTEEVTAMIYFVIPVRTRLWTMAAVMMGLSFGLGVLQIFGISFDNVAHFAHLGGALTGWYFIRLLGYNGRPVSYDRLWQERQAREQRNRELAVVPRRKRVVDMDEPDNMIVPPRNSREFIEREIDPLLDKIHAHGIASLTDKERDILERARQEILNLGGE